ncbi:uncharacterized protein C10orf67, mitochondrial-like [Mya arenaria]|uniref:uncharacterized protein C10orf67, mitochondrial-like n=1 Tax=Mya arenaria TaxID=6604 RepID=UPI0022E010BA|nr:uncharacterized protein C10orf67, mitochondrial-like [Mya arenaria]
MLLFGEKFGSLRRALLIATNMALLLRDPSGANYGNTEQELQDRILSVYGSNENDDHLFRPDLADQHKVGFFGLDRASQTDVTEVVDLKEMTEVLQILLRDVDELKRDINLTKHVMQADYESKLRERSLELYCRINERVSDLEKMHEERVGTVRRAFRQQLSDAIARVAVLYNKNLQRKVRQEKSQNESDADLREERYKELQATIQRNESIIQMLKSQIEQLQNNRSQSVSPSLDDSERPSAVTPQTPSSAGKVMSYADTPPGSAVTPVRPPSVRERGVQVAIKPVMKSKEVQIEGSLHSKTPSVNYEAEALRDELDAATQRLSSLQDSLQEREDENTKLSKKVDSLDDELTNERMEKEKLRMEIQSIHSALQQDKANSQKMHSAMDGANDEMIEKQKEEMEKLMQERLRQAQMQSSQTLEEEAKARQKAEKEKLAFMYDQEKKLKEELAREYRQQLNEERAKLAEALKGDTDVNKLRKQEQALREEVARLKKEIERIHKTWEKKFAILQQSLHALKDESYIRQQLQRQAANLHHAAVSYSVDSPLGIHPTKNRSSVKRPLPEIPKYSKPVNPGATPGGFADKDYISYTVSAPSGRGTAIFSADENQIMSETDREDIPADVVPLPDRPTRNSAPPSKTSSPVKQHKGPVIIVPHVT